MLIHCPYCMTRAEEFGICPCCGQIPGDYTPAPHHLPPGTVLENRYVLGGALGEGGFGITYLGWDPQLGERIAVKEYFPLEKATRFAGETFQITSYVGAGEETYREGKDRFLQEARILETLGRLPQILHVRACFEANNTAYIVMEYVQGITLTQWLQQRGEPLSPEELLPRMRGVFAALDKVHSLGLIHRDISPDNMMLSGGQLRLLDFGCARESSRRTETFTQTLRHGYAPVEQYQPMGQSTHSDVYALSATIYYCLTGITPPHALERLCGDTLQPPHLLGIPMDPRQEQVLLYGLGVRPRRRFQTMDAMARELYGPDWQNQ